jgi:large subunit ribosomal protein L21
MSYAIITLGGKQYVVHEGDRLLVDRLSTEEGKTFAPDVLFLGGDGAAEFEPAASSVSAKVVGHVLGEKVRIGKYRKRTGYKRHTGFRARLTEIQIESVSGKRPTKKAEPKQAKAAPPAEAPGEAPAGVPEGYADLTVAQIADGAKTWERDALEAALAYEREHAARKGAISALESAIARTETE